MLEWHATCPACKGPVGGVALPPWSWRTRLLGARCRKCDRVIGQQDTAHKAMVERLRAESEWQPPGGWGSPSA